MKKLISDLTEYLGPKNVIIDEPDKQPYVVDWRKIISGKACAVALPSSTEEVASTVRICAAHGVSIVPQGGNTGQVAGAVPGEVGESIVMSLKRMNAIRAIDTKNNTMTVEAGCILKNLQEAANSAGRLFPLSLGAEGSCLIGGNLGTNAGGTQVLRYGNARELTIGLEVVLANGEVWSSLRGLRKDNSGYDLRDIFIGSEGTLGIITAATLRLFPQTPIRHTALAALPSVDAATELLSRCRDEAQEALTAFELISGACLRLVQQNCPDKRMPLHSIDSPWYCLIEVAHRGENGRSLENFHRIFEDVIECEQASDVLVAQSLAQAEAMWGAREMITSALAHDGKCIKHDISLPISEIPAFVRETDELLQARYPGVRNFTFGHLGDGNLHYNVARRASGDDADLHAMQPGLSLLVHDAVERRSGSISAEQGIGRIRTADLIRYKAPLELQLMWAIKRTLDPNGLLNPGVLLPSFEPWMELRGVSSADRCCR
ncbi:FAD-binding oxidoreductase [Bradyrhizobium retamae]|uniref:Hydroxyacid dehydrogenase n=1 Tax=Bradyrhizobium retamae TaxID=1300035 RepID=A0A0R3M5Z7_9BRAD|nr:FAD-binding oxidoreductase [Bradyrhizobium retamae]KRR15054.1 hydroxyacid dehydrogenase [Bradyrhizobium retamae]